MNNNFIRYVLIVMAVTGLTWFSIARAEPANSFRLTVTAVSPEISKADPVTVELLFECSNQTVRLYRHPIFGIAAAAQGPGDWLSFIIATPSGESVKDYGTHLPGPKRPSRNDYVEVGPDSPYRETIKLYPSSLERKAEWSESGTYQLQAVYSYEQNISWEYGQDLWEGTIKSSPITFTVTQ
jgi:hypothetical protein